MLKLVARVPRSSRIERGARVVYTRGNRLFVLSRLVLDRIAALRDVFPCTLDGVATGKHAESAC